MEKFLAPCSGNRVINYSLFSFEVLHNLHPGISKSVREYTVKYMLSDLLRAGRAQKKLKAIVTIQALILQGCSRMLSAIEING